MNVAERHTSLVRVTKKLSSLFGWRIETLPNRQQINRVFAETTAHLAYRYVVTNTITLRRLDNLLTLGDPTYKWMSMATQGLRHFATCLTWR